MTQQLFTLQKLLMDSLTLLPANKLNHRDDYCLVLDVLAEMMMKYWVEDEFNTQKIFKRHIVRIANHCILYVRPSIYDLLHWFPVYSNLNVGNNNFTKKNKRGLRIKTQA